ncbi:MAG: serine protease [Dietzia psychralcaliphila]
MSARRSSLSLLVAVMLATTAGCSFSLGTEDPPPSEAGSNTMGESGPGAEEASMNPQALDDSVVFLMTTVTGYVLFPGGENGEYVWSDEVTAVSSCTGWMAGEGGEIMTAGHCVDQDEGRSALIGTFLSDFDVTAEEVADAEINWSVEGLKDGSDIEVVVVAKQPNIDGATINDWEPVQIVDVMPFEQGDLALLRANGLRADSQPPVMTVADEDPQTGDSVTSIGFPGAIADVSNTKSIQNPSFKTGTVSSRQVSPRGVAGYEINADISSGMSGGPTVNEAGQVVGVNSYTIRGESQAFNFITTTADLRRFLDRNGVD